MTAGDELKLSLDPVGERAFGRPWEGLGQVLRISDSEVSLMMLCGNIPLEITDGYQVTSWTEIVLFVLACHHRDPFGTGAIQTGFKAACFVVVYPVELD